MDLILHVGQHKTGTTSIQQFLAKHRNFFQSYGIYIPTTGQDPNFGHHLALMLGLRLTGDNVLVEDFRKEISYKDIEKILISTEVVKNFIVENRYLGFLENFRSLGMRNFKIVMYVRNPFHLVNASYCEQTKSLAVDGSAIGVYAERYINRKYQGHYRFFDYFNVIELAKQPDVEVVLRPYNPSIAKSVLADFLSLLGLPNQGDFLEPRDNPSPGPIAIEALRTISREVGPVEPAKKIKLIRRLNVLLGDFPEPAPFWGIDEEIAGSAALAKADAQTELLSQFAWGRPWREVIGNESRPVNVFDPATASSERFKSYERMLDRMRKTVASEGF